MEDSQLNCQLYDQCRRFWVCCAIV